MKVIVICIDSLDYDKVVRFGLKNLEQKEFGKTIVPITPQGHVLSPHVWSSFLCGRVTDFTTFRKYDNGLMQSIMRRFHPNIGLGRIASAIGIKQRHYRPSDLQGSILDETKSMHIGMPFYTPAFEEGSNILDRYFKKKITADEMKEMLIRQFTDLKGSTLEALSRRGDWDVFMMYFHFLDVIQHMFYKDEEYVRNIYRSLDEFMYNVSKLAGNDLLIVVSDHGAENGDHTKRGFYSFNKHIGLKDPKITDFKKLIQDMINKR